MTDIRNYLRAAENELVRGANELQSQIDELRRQRVHIEHDAQQKVKDIHSAMMRDASLIYHEQNISRKAQEEAHLLRLRSELKHKTHDVDVLEHSIDRQIVAKQDALRHLNDIAATLRHLESSSALH